MAVANKGATVEEMSPRATVALAIKITLEVAIRRPGTMVTGARVRRGLMIGGIILGLDNEAAVAIEMGTAMNAATRGALTGTAHVITAIPEMTAARTDVMSDERIDGTEGKTEDVKTDEIGGMNDGMANAMVGVKIAAIIAVTAKHIVQLTRRTRPALMSQLPTLNPALRAGQTEGKTRTRLYSGARWSRNT